MRALLGCHDPDSPLARAIGADRKGRLSLLVYLIGIGLTFVSQWFGVALYAFVALVWLVPDRRIERKLRS